MLLLWFVLILTVKKRWFALGNRNLHDCIYVSISCSVALWTYLQLGNASTMEVNTDWKSLQLFFFYGREKIIKLATDERTKIEENLNETVKQCLK